MKRTLLFNVMLAAAVASGCSGSSGQETPTVTPTTTATPDGPTPTPTATPDGPTPTTTATPDGPTPTPTATPDGPTPTPTATPDGPTSTPTATPDGPTPTPTAGGSTSTDLDTLNPDLFDIHTVIEDFTTTSCTLSDGSTSTCYKVVVGNEPAEWGPSCPATYDEVGGVGFYDPDGEAVLYALDSTLWDLMEADGYDIVNEDGTVNVVIPSGPPGGGGPPTGGPPTKAVAAAGSCLDAELETDIKLTFLIPTAPQLAGSVTEIEIPGMPYSGISLDGLPFAPPPPATVSGGAAALPALDPCGGHPEPDGPFHWHLTPHEANNVLTANGIRDDVRCSAIAQISDGVIGYAADGFAILGSQELDGSNAADLDECGGHTVEERYHYHASATTAPNNISCLKGVTATQFSQRE